MSLHEIDKNGDTRLTPQVNSPDNVTNRMAHNTYGNSYRDASGQVIQRMRFMNGLILTYDNAGRISSAYGYIPAISSTPVLIIAKAGSDVFIDILNTSAPTV